VPAGTRENPSGAISNDPKPLESRALNVAPLFACSWILQGQWKWTLGQSRAREANDTATVK
jgi:hypothetical protein